MATKKKTVEERINEVIRKEDDLYEKAGISRVPFVAFPNRIRIPIRGHIALLILKTCGAELRERFFVRN